MSKGPCARWVSPVWALLDRPKEITSNEFHHLCKIVRQVELRLTLLYRTVNHIVAVSCGFEAQPGCRRDEETISLVGVVSV